MSEEVRAGVIGVGNMGENHARVYDSMPETTLAGVFDVDDDQAEDVADRYDTRATTLDELVADVDVASVVVPTAHHYDMARACIDSGVDVLVEKPFVADPERGRELAAAAAENDVTIQVGHVERFNPVVEALQRLVDDIDVVSVNARRIGPPPERDIGDSVIMDLMIHDVDVVLDSVDDELAAVDAFGRETGEYATATMEFDSGVVGRLTASRVARKKVRELVVSAAECRVEADYIDQTVTVRWSPDATPSERDVDVPTTTVDDDGTVVQRLDVDDKEPLRNELQSFVRSVETETRPAVTATDGLAVLEVTRALERAASGGDVPAEETAVDALQIQAD